MGRCKGNIKQMEQDPCSFDMPQETVAETAPHAGAVDQSRDINIFKKISNQLYDNLEESDISQQENWMFSQGPVSGSFLKFLKKNRNRYDAFIFFTYLYATTYLGLPLVAHKSVLVPTAHDELMIKMKIWDHFFKLPRGYIFLSDGEKDFLIKRFPNTKLSGPIAKILIKPPPKNHPISFRKKYKINNPYIFNAYFSNKFFIFGNNYANICRFIFQFFYNFLGVIIGRKKNWINHCIFCKFYTTYNKEEIG